MGGGDLEFLQADGGAEGEGAGQQAGSAESLSSRHPPHHNYLYAHQVASLCNPADYIRGIAVICLWQRELAARAERSARLPPAHPLPILDLLCAAPLFSSGAPGGGGGACNPSRAVLTGWYMAWYLQASTGKRMHRTHSHNKLVHEAVSVCVSPPLSCACVALFLSFLCSSLSSVPLFPLFLSFIPAQDA